MNESVEAPQEQPKIDDAAIENIADAYLMDLGLDWDNLKGKKVLDIGAGLAGFAHAGKKRGIDVVSLEAPTDLWSREGLYTKGVSFILGNGKQLPFKNETFDMIVARSAIHSLVEIQEDLDEVISEAKRVLKPGGEFRFGPGNIGIRPVREDEWDKWFELLEKVRNKQDISPKEEAWRAKIWPAYERELQEEADLTGLSTEERINKLENRTIADLRKIEPSITAYSIVIELNWKDKIEQFPSVYYVMKKPL